jgi:hypothetical protein
MKTQTVVMALTKQTKGTYVYASDAEGAVCTQLYLRKEQVGKEVPAIIKLTIEAADGGEVDGDALLAEVLAQKA